MESASRGLSLATRVAMYGTFPPACEKMKRTFGQRAKCRPTTGSRRREWCRVKLDGRQRDAIFFIPAMQSHVVG